MQHDRNSGGPDPAERNPGGLNPAERNPGDVDRKSGPGKKSKHKEREDKRAAALRENLLRRKSQARARREGEARNSKGADKEAEVDLEVKAIVPDTEGAAGAATKADR